MRELEVTLINKRANEPEEVNDEFRLWISAEPHPNFPVGLLHLSIKVTNEAPSGIKAGLKGSYAWLTQDHLDAITGPSGPTWRTMLSALAFMHTVVQERRKFGALGFCILHEFNQADLSACTQFIQNHITEVDGKKRPVDWPTVNYMVCEVQYGGKITDAFDLRLFNTYGQAWLAMRVMEPGFEFFKGYKVPTGTDIDIFRKYIESLSLVDNPELFGLHSNADLVFRTAQTTAVLSTILDICVAVVVAWLVVEPNAILCKVRMRRSCAARVAPATDDAADGKGGKGKKKGGKDAKAGGKSGANGKAGKTKGFGSFGKRAKAKV